MATPNPPIRGHHLLHEGATYRRWDHTVPSPTGEIWVGGCECGARPEGFPDNISVNAMKRWHRQHKAELRGQTTTPTEEGILMYVSEAAGGRIHGYIGRDEPEYPEEGWYRLVPTNVAASVEAATVPATSLEVERHEIKGPNVIVDTRPRCGAPNPSVTDIFCDKPGDHEGLHGAYYGWNGKAEVWS